MCHCLACQRRSGSVFAVQAWFTSEQVKVVGRFNDFVRLDDDHGEARTFHFCPDCGATVFYAVASHPDLTAVSVGAFADPSFPPPTRSSYDSRRHEWVALPDTIERDEAWDELLPLYESGDYTAVADRGRGLIEAHPQSGRLLYNVACCESRIGRTDDAIEHLQRAIGVHEPLRSLAAGDSDFDAIREEPAFKALLGSGS